MSAEGTEPESGQPATLGDGAAIRVLAFDGAVLHFIGERAHPPGRPLEVKLVLEGDALVVLGKAVGSKQRPDARFDVRLRLHSLRKRARELLERGLPHEPEP